jgi:hypothetical protein
MSEFGQLAVVWNSVFVDSSATQLPTFDGFVTSLLLIAYSSIPRHCPPKTVVRTLTKTLELGGYEVAGADSLPTLST